MSPVAARRRVGERLRELSLRTRLVAVVALAVGVAVVGVVGVSYLAVRHELIGQVDAQLRQQADEVRRQVAFFSGQGLPIPQPRRRVGEQSAYVQVVAADGRSLAAQDQEVELPVTAVDRRIAAGGPAQVRETSVDGERVRMLTAPVLDGVAVQVALPIGPVEGQLARLALAFLALAAAALAAAVVIARILSRGVLAPVGELTETAELITTTRDLSLRISPTRRDELGRLASTFDTMLDALEQSIAAQRQLVADASHELRTPLASLRTNVEVLHDVDRLPQAQRRELLDGMVRQIQELTALVADIVELARGDQRASEPVDVELGDLVAAAVARARRHWPQVSFDADIVAVTVRGDPMRLDRAAANLLDNAGKFTPPGGRVTVSLSADGTLRVADGGPGVPADALPHVFDRFYRADEARGMPGSGLGLAIVKQVADTHGGAVTLTNAPEGGAVASLWLPVVSAEDSEPAPTAVG